jgi:glycine C-acetyltransferase/8-amino-7-oxononanoate synthase
VLRELSAAAAGFGTGAGSSRLVAGTLAVHEALEAALSRTVSADSVLLFGSGYLANLGAIPALVRRSDLIVADRHSHASLIDGAALSRAHLRRYRHNDLEHLQDLLSGLRRVRRPGQRLLIVTESLFSMDGDCAPLQEIHDLAIRSEAMLLVDEAHALGVYGSGGGGLLSDDPLRFAETVRTFSFGKSLASYGGAVAGPRELRELLIQRARTFMFDTALPPSSAAAALAGLSLFEDAERRAHLRQSAAWMRSRLAGAGFVLPPGDSHILPLIVPGNRECSELSRLLLLRGVLAACIRSPAVPAGTERVRLSISAAHREDDLEEAAAAIEGAAKELRLIP